MLWKEKVFHIFPKGTSSKVYIIARLDFSHSCFDSRGQHFSYYAMRTPTTYLANTNFSLILTSIWTLSFLSNILTI